jgi:hypothetical protein
MTISLVYFGKNFSVELIRSFASTFWSRNGAMYQLPCNMLEDIILTILHQCLEVELPCKAY